MDGGEVHLSSQIIFSNPERSTSLDELLRNTRTRCTQTDACHPPGPTATPHTHACSHVFSSDDDGCGSDTAKRKKASKPLGNREAVRKYREKKKAHDAYLKEEVEKLRAINQQLVERLQRQAALEAEAARLRTLLVDVRAKIDGALGDYQSQTQCGGGIGLRCDELAQCFVGKSESGGLVKNCEIDQNQDIVKNLQIASVLNSIDAVGSLVSSVSGAE